MAGMTVKGAATPTTTKNDSHAGGAHDVATKVETTKPDGDAATGASTAGDKPVTTGTKTASEEAAKGAKNVRAKSAAADAPAGAPGAAAHGTGTSHSGGSAAKYPALATEVNKNGSDPRFLDGTRGPLLDEGGAPTVKIPDGKGFDGSTGRKQNADDKKQNNYSVTDANYNPALGLLASNPDTGEVLNYNEHTATYNAAGYLKSTAEWYAEKGDSQYLDEYNKISDSQNAGTGTVLGATSYVMGLFNTPDPALAGVNVELLRSMAATIPGTDRSAFEYVRDSEDVTGQAWARMHHAESSWDMYYNLLDAGAPGELSLKFSGDDGVSGSGRLNGFNNQDGDNGFNAGEVEIWKEAAQYEARTGIPVIQAMMAGHDHLLLTPGAKTRPNANNLLGLNPNDTSASLSRAAAVRNGLLNGTLDENRNTNNNNTNNDGNADDGGTVDNNGGAGNNNGATGGGGGGTKQLPALDYRQPAYVDPASLRTTHYQPQDVNPNDPRFAAGTVGPIVPEGEAPTVKVPDGVGFFGLEGRQQNANDKKQNNYSVTDANFQGYLGLMAGVNGEPLNYVQQIQLYSAAGYLEVFAPEIYAILVAMQDAGGMTVLEGAAYIMGILDAPEAADAIGADRIASINAAMAEAGIGKIGEDARIPATIPGTSMDAKTYALSTTDITGQDWARPHHPQAAFDMLKNLLAAGIPEDQAFILAGDDAVSGSGRLNGFNNQDGDDSFNADEAAVFRMGAEIERQTGIPVVQLMMTGHDHLSIDKSALTDPTINKLIGLAADDRSASPARAAAISQALLADIDGLDINGLDQHQIKNDRLRSAMTGIVTPLAPAQAAAGVAALGGMTGMTGMAGMTATSPAPAAVQVQAAPVAAQPAVVTNPS